MLWVVFALVVMVGGVLIRRRRTAEYPADEPWRASLDDGDDGPLDMKEIRRAEAEWGTEKEWDDPSDGEEWR